MLGGQLSAAGHIESIASQTKRHYRQTFSPPGYTSWRNSISAESVQGPMAYECQLLNYCPCLNCCMSSLL